MKSNADTFVFEVIDGVVGSQENITKYEKVQRRVEATLYTKDTETGNSHVSSINQVLLRR